MTTTRFYFACGDCEAGRGVPCHPSCPSRLAHDRDLVEADEWDDDPHHISALAAGRAFLGTES